MVKLTDIKGIGPATIKILQERKIKTVEALASLSLEELRKIPGFKGELRARAVKQAAADSLRDKPAKPAVTVDSSPQTVTDQTLSPPKADKEKDKDKDKKKARKDDKKADKDKKKKSKDKKKDAKKKDKKKS